MRAGEGRRGWAAGEEGQSDEQGLCFYNLISTKNQL